MQLQKGYGDNWLARVTVHFTDTITQTSVYSPNYTVYWTLKLWYYEVILGLSQLSQLYSDRAV